MDALCKESRENFHCLWQMTRQKFTNTQKQKNAKYLQKRINKTEVFSIITPDILLPLFAFTELFLESRFQIFEMSRGLF